MKPMPSPAIRDALLGSRSQAIAIKAPNIGLVALRIDDNPAGMYSAARLKARKGTAELVRPTTAIGLQ